MSNEANTATKCPANCLNGAVSRGRYYTDCPTCGGAGTITEGAPRPCCKSNHGAKHVTTCPLAGGR